MHRLQPFTLDMGGLPLLMVLERPLIIQLIHLEGVFEPDAGVEGSPPEKPAFFLWAFQFDRCVCGRLTQGQMCTQALPLRTAPLQVNSYAWREGV